MCVVVLFVCLFVCLLFVFFCFLFFCFLFFCFFFCFVFFFVFCFVFFFFVLFFFCCCCCSFFFFVFVFLFLFFYVCLFFCTSLHERMFCRSPAFRVLQYFCWTSCQIGRPVLSPKRCNYYSAIYNVQYPGAILLDISIRFCNFRLLTFFYGGHA